MDGTSANDSTPEQNEPKRTLALTFAHSVDQFRLEVDEAISLAGVTGVFGRSGSGKSTLLRIIAGLTQPHTGTVQCRGELWSNAETRFFLPAQRRSVGFMFQDARLFGHLDVAGNLAYPIGRRRQRAQSMPEHVATIHLDEVVAALDLGPLLSRRPTSLSGGEKQRVALARTLLTNPALLLLDEPLAALDLERKREIVPFLESALAQFNLPALYVSHDPEEVSRVADRLLVLENGRVTHHGPAASVFAALAPDGAMPLAEAGAAVTTRVLRHDERLHSTYLDFAGTELTVPLASSAAIGSSKRIWLRARDVAIATERPQGLSIRNQLPCTIASLQPIRSTGTVDVTLHCADAQLHCQLTLAAVEELQLKPQLPVWALIKSVVLHT